ncbi:hypothetical protein KSP40_PGU017845 [Platanthera guangdongensis]|uniref:CAF1B/HIR1 beta-propeller domain-containing protein n=1 Tax=Platanthera guangdongensis TaxID=2320717 RepID=A0ABR2MP19_9ASPA
MHGHSSGGKRGETKDRALEGLSKAHGCRGIEGAHLRGKQWRHGKDRLSEGTVCANAGSGITTSLPAERHCLREAKASMGGLSARRNKRKKKQARWEEMQSHELIARPAVQLPGASKPIVAVRFCPILFCLRGSKTDSLFKLPYRVIFAVATLNSLYIYDSESAPPIVIVAGLHYAAITDISWSPNAEYVAVSSQDGYCSILEFDDEELGVPFSLGDSKSASEGIACTTNMKADEEKKHEAQPTLTKASGANKPTKRRISAIAIN